jgi:rod shape determining protein RodA
MNILRRTTGDPVLVALAVLLSIYGIAMVYSAGQTDAPVNLIRNNWEKQIVWLGIALCAGWAASRASVRMLEWVTWPAYVGTILVLALTLVIGTGAGTAASSRSWLAIGGHRIGQPAEFAKITVILMLARVLARRREAPKTLLDLWKPAVVVGIPWLLIVKQPDLGTSIVFIAIFFALLFWTGIDWQLLVFAASPVVSLLLASSTLLWGAWFLLLLALVYTYRPYLIESVMVVVANVAMGVIAPILWDHMKPQQRQRLLTFLDPSQDPRGSGYHVLQSQVAIGSGGWFGTGFTHGPQKRLAFLPEQHTDFIFAVTGEELGFLGVTVALALFLALLIRSTRAATQANEPFSSLVAFGLMAGWLCHVVENVGMTLNLMPVTGIPLPFFSYGGSFLVSCWISVGILARISKEGRGRGEPRLL